MPDRCGDRTVTQQVVVHIDERLVHRFIDQQSAKARAVDKQVSIESATFLGSKRGDVPLLSFSAKVIFSCTCTTPRFLVAKRRKKSATSAASKCQA